MDGERLHNQTLDTVETYRREVSELRRSLADVTHERDTLSHSNSLLRETVRNAESERIRYNPERMRGSFRETKVPIVSVLFQCEAAA